MIRCKVLTRTDVHPIVSRIDSKMNEEDLDLSTLSDSLKPFLQCWTSGTYRVQVTRGEDCEVIEYNSADPLDLLEQHWMDSYTIYCTQPSDLLDQQRITYYEELIKQGKRPALLLFQSDYASFLIDGHHKLKAYKNLGLIQEGPMITIVPTPVKITRDEEQTYVQHSHEAVAQYTDDSQRHKYD